MNHLPTRQQQDDILSSSVSSNISAKSDYIANDKLIPTESIADTNSSQIKELDILRSLSN